MNTQPPVILTFTPFDPAGRSGVLAANEVIASLGCHHAAVATALCATGNSATPDIIPVDSNLLIQQARSILEDMPVAAIFVGYAGSVPNLEAIHSILVDYPDIPVIASSALNNWDNSSQAMADYPNAFMQLVASMAELVIADQQQTPVLTSNAKSEELIHPIFASQCAHLLSYQCIASARGFEYTLYSDETVLHTFNWQAGCCQPQSSAVEDTIASAIAAYMAHGSTTQTAATQGLKFASLAAASARRLGFDSPIPNRFFWAKEQFE